MLRNVITLALWFAFALVMAFTAQAYGWTGVAVIFVLITLGHVYFRLKEGRWSL